MRKLIEKLIIMEVGEWHAITMRMGWHFRTPIHRAHPVILAGLKGVSPTKAEWTKIRLTVNAARKADASRVARYERQQRNARRRVRMAAYMRQYRARKKREAAQGNSGHAD